MEFSIGEEGVKKLVLLEFQGEFVRPEEMNIEMEDSTIHFEMSSLKGRKSDIGEHLVFRQSSDAEDRKALEIAGVIREKVEFVTRPKYNTKRKS